MLFDLLVSTEQKAVASKLKKAMKDMENRKISLAAVRVLATLLNLLVSPTSSYVNLEV